MKGLLAQLPHAMGAPQSARQTQAACIPPGRPGPGPHTDGAVLAIPARAALALAVAAGSVLCAARVAGALVAGRPHPAVLAAARSPHADAVAPAVSSADLCGAGRGETKQALSKLFWGTRVTLGSPLPGSMSCQGSRGSGLIPVDKDPLRE